MTMAIGGPVEPGERLPIPNGVWPFEEVAERTKTACFNSGRRVEEHFGEIADSTKNLEF
jgi:hypothetical protein